MNTDLVRVIPARLSWLPSLVWIHSLQVEMVVYISKKITKYLSLSSSNVFQMKDQIQKYNVFQVGKNTHTYSYINFRFPFWGRPNCNSHSPSTASTTQRGWLRTCQESVSKLQCVMAWLTSNTHEYHLIKWLQATNITSKSKLKKLDFRYAISQKSSCETLRLRSCHSWPVVGKWL